MTRLSRYYELANIPIRLLTKEQVNELIALMKLMNGE